MFEINKVKESDVKQNIKKTSEMSKLSVFKDMLNDSIQKLNVQKSYVNFQSNVSPIITSCDERPFEKGKNFLKKLSNLQLAILHNDKEKEKPEEIINELKSQLMELEVEALKISDPIFQEIILRGYIEIEKYEILNKKNNSKHLKNDNPKFKHNFKYDIYRK